MSFRFDIFISYSHDDAAVVRPLIDRLHADDLRVWVDEDEIAGGDPLIASMVAGITDSAHVVPCLSLSYLAKDWTAFEAAVNQVMDPANRNHRTIPVRVRPCAIPPEYSWLYCPDLTDSGTWETEYRKMLRHVREDTVEATPTAPPPRRRLRDLMHRIFRTKRALLAISLVVAVAVIGATWASGSWPPGKTATVTRTTLYSAAFDLWSTDSPDPCLTYSAAAADFEARITCFHTQSLSTPNQMFVDFDVEIATQKVSGGNLPWYGVAVVTRANSSMPMRAHRFALSGLGTYTYEVAGLDTQGQQTDLNIVVPATASPAIHLRGATNTLSLIRHGSVVEFRANGQLLSTQTIQIDPYEPVRIGLMALTPNSGPAGEDMLDVKYSRFQVFVPQ